jgi:hypothetical protein
VSKSSPGCEQCEQAPATYIDNHGALVCADCASWLGAVGHGEQYAAVQLLKYAIDTMRGAGFNDEQILAAVEHGGEGQLSNERPEERWLRGCVPLSAVEGGA